MVCIPSLEEEDARRPGRERDKPARERAGLGSQIRGLSRLFGICDFKPHLKKAPLKLETLRMRSGEALPLDIMAQLRRLMKRLVLAGGQIAEIDAARVADLKAEKRPGEERGLGMIRLLAGETIETEPENPPTQAGRRAGLGLRYAASRWVPPLGPWPSRLANWP